MKSALQWLCVFSLLFSATTLAVIETYDFSTVELEQRYRVLSAELRCPKCQNQNIADSDAPIAQDLRQTLHKQLEGGASDDEILDYMVQRYGEFVRYRPKFGGVTTILWLAPILLLMAGAGVVVLNFRGRMASGVSSDVSGERSGDVSGDVSSKESSAAPEPEKIISASEREKLRVLLDGDGDEKERDS